MNKATRLENYPPLFYDVLERVKEQGIFSVRLASEKQAMAVRQKFYSFFYSLQTFEPEGRGKFTFELQIRRRGEWVEISRKDDTSEFEAISEALNRGYSIPIINEDLEKK